MLPDGSDGGRSFNEQLLLWLYSKVGIRPWLFFLANQWNNPALLFGAVLAACYNSPMAAWLRNSGDSPPPLNPLLATLGPHPCSPKEPASPLPSMTQPLRGHFSFHPSMSVCTLSCVHFWHALVGGTRLKRSAARCK